MFEANVFRIMIGCPSDIQEEVTIAKKIILEWTQLNAETHKIVLLPLHWQDNSYPGYGKHPQKILDKQLVEKSDMLVCIFGSKIGTATDTSDSGSIEEIEEHVKKGKHVMILFKRNVNIADITPEQLQRLTDFKRRIQPIALWSEFSDAHEFGESFKKSLALFVNENWLNLENVTQQEKEVPQFSDKELEILKNWAKDTTGTPYTHINNIGGITEIHLAYKYVITLANNKARACWEDFIDRLISVGYVKLDRYDKNAHPIYKLTAKGYEFAENI